MVTEKYNQAFIEKVNISQMQTLSSLEMIARGRFICAQCPEPSDALRGVL